MTTSPPPTRRMTASPIPTKIHYADSQVSEDEGEGAADREDILHAHHLHLSTRSTSPDLPSPPTSSIAVVSSGSFSTKPKTWMSLKDSFWLTRIVLLRSLAFVHFFNFLACFFQLPALVGFDGLLPAHLHLQRLLHRGASESTQYDLNIFWLFYDILPKENWPLMAIPAVGLVIAAFILWTGRANVLMIATLWLCQHSIREIGQIFWGYGWELQISETTFLAFFLVPFFSLDRFCPETPPSLIVLWLYRYLLGRIMLGAGLIKLRGDQCWRDLTCMEYHYETQPVPSPLSWYFHHTPSQFHSFEVLVNHAVELGFPFLLAIPFSPVIRRLAGLLQVGFQFLIIFSGNLSFLNWLTIIPALACFDDRMWQPFFSSSVFNHVLSLRQVKPRRFLFRWPNPLLTTVLLITILYLSTFPIANMLDPHQTMNRSFDRYNLVNTYGAFGSVGKERFEVIMLGLPANATDASQLNWIEYEFKCKPGRVDRRPCILGPYHHRVDWQIWFAAMQPYQHNPWLISLVGRLLNGTDHAESYLSYNPFPDQPPAQIKLELYRYHYSDGFTNPQWWTREYVQPYVPIPLSLDNPSLQTILKGLHGTT